MKTREMDIREGLWVRKDNHLCPKGSDDYITIMDTDHLYPERVLCRCANGEEAYFQQVSPTLYVFAEAARTFGVEADK